MSDSQCSRSQHSAAQPLHHRLTAAAPPLLLSRSGWLMKQAKARNPDIKLFGLSWSVGITGNDGERLRAPLLSSDHRATAAAAASAA